MIFKSTPPQHLSRQQQLLFFRSLALALASGVPYLRALSGIEASAREAGQTQLVEVVVHCKLQLSKGRSLSETMRPMLDVFTPLQIAIVKLGEEMGQVEAMLAGLAEAEERRWHTEQRLRNALIYPLFVFGLASVLLVLLLPLWVFPHYLAMLDSIQFAPEGAFALFVQLLRWTQSGGFWALLITAGLATSALLRSSRARSIALRSLLLALPLENPELLSKLRRTGEARYLKAAGEALLLERAAGLARVLQASWAARFARALELTSRGGSLKTGLVLAAEVSGSALLSLQVADMLACLERGGTLQETLSEGRVFPSLFLQMIAIGEESGKLPELCLRCANFYESEIEHELETALSILEPMLTMALGVVVGGVVLATLYPIVQIVKTL